MTALRLLVSGLSLALLGTLVACTTGSTPPTAPVSPSDSDSRNATASLPLPLPARSFNAAILTCTPDEVVVANYLKARSAI
ncbi:MAG: hypothetical protein ABI743_10325, partial [bacterium]